MIECGERLDELMNKLSRTGLDFELKLDKENLINECKNRENN